MLMEISSYDILRKSNLIVRQLKNYLFLIKYFDNFIDFPAIFQLCVSHYMYITVFNPTITPFCLYFTNKKAEDQNSYKIGQSLYSGKEIQNQISGLSDTKTNAFLLLCYHTNTQMAPQNCWSELVQYYCSLVFYSFCLVTKQERMYYFSQMAAKLQLWKNWWPLF